MIIKLSNQSRLKIILLMTFGGVLTGKAFGQTLAYTQDDIIKTAGVAESQIFGLSATNKQTTISYYDGMGRIIQSVGLKASPLQNDIIQPVAYDNLGRQTVSYLPYAGQSSDVAGGYRSDAISAAQPSFYNQTSQYLITTDGSPYAQKVFENSPLQRLLSDGMVGNGYQPTGATLTGGSGTQHFKTATYRSNNSSDGNILIFNPDGSYTANNYYITGKLSVTDAKDEDNVETLTYTDMQGHLILKRQILSSGNLDTYYIYNNAGMLGFIIPPLATNQLAANSYNLTITPLSNIIFKFVYDNRGRLVEKTVPGKGTMYIVYDPLNRPVLLQDANMLALNKWNYIKYDAKGHVVSQGIYTDATSTRLGRVNMQNYVNGLATSYNAAWYEVRNNNIAGGYYSSAIFPTAATGTLLPLAFAYYDDYDLDQNGAPDVNYIPQQLTGEETPTTGPLKGVPTIISKATVGPGIAANTFLSTATFYDKQGNPIQTQSNNQVYYLGMTTLTDVATTVPNFMGVPLITKVSQQTSATNTVSVQTNLTYDQMFRITAVSQAYNGGALTKVAGYTYNELGQVIKKSVGFVNSTTWLQKIDMRYNIRGQLLNINNSKLNSDGGVTNNDGLDVFGMQMLYDGTDSNLGNTPYYDGKLSAVKWMSKDASGVKSYERAYKYNYDAVNRYTGEVYAERTPAGTTAFNRNLDGFDESIGQYDAGGNIKSLSRNASTQGTTTNAQIDNLTYTYDVSNNPNKLLTVSDAATVAGTSNDAGFTNLAHNTTGVYVYDTNGNLTTDPYKGLNIGYDVLNRTDKITVNTATNRWIDYTYDAGGNLLRKRQYDNVSGVATLQNTTDYVNGFVYINNNLSYFMIPEGREINIGGATVTLKQEFVIADQQGNARVSFQDNGSGVAIVTQENSYYGFGLILPNSPVGTLPGANKKLYNGDSEWQNDYNTLPDYYQTFNRNYDAALGRFVGVDPVAESAESMTSYQYAGNNPIMNNDPLGDQVSHKWVPPVSVFNGYDGYSSLAGGAGGGGWDPMSVFTGDSGDGPWTPSNISSLEAGIAYANAQADAGQAWVNQQEKEYIKENGIKAILNADGSWTLPTGFSFNEPDKDGYAKIINGTSGLGILKEVEVRSTRTASLGGGEESAWSSVEEWGEKFLNVAENIISAGKAAPLINKSSKALGFASKGAVFLEEIGGRYIPFLDAAIASDKFSRREISGGEYAYSLTGTGAGYYTEMEVGAEFGGPYGALAGLGVGLTFKAASAAYDFAKPGWDQFTQAVGQINYNLNNSRGNPW